MFPRWKVQSKCDNEPDLSMMKMNSWWLEKSDCFSSGMKFNIKMSSFSMPSENINTRDWKFVGQSNEN